jgi:hypothetical protein
MANTDKILIGLDPVLQEQIVAFVRDLVTSDNANAVAVHHSMPTYHEFFETRRPDGTHTIIISNRPGWAQRVSDIAGLGTT